MAGEKPRKGCFTLGEYFVDLGDNTISMAEQCAHVEPKAMDVLYQLACQSGETVTREELLAAVWGDRIVVEEALTRTISQLRIALQDNKSKSIIQTVPKRGYRLKAKVIWHSNIGSEDAATKTSSLAQPSSLIDSVRRQLKNITGLGSFKTSLIITFLLLLIIILTVVVLSPLNKEAKEAEITAIQSQSIAILPFRTLSEEKETLYLAQGLPENLLNKLSSYSQLHVLSRYSSFSPVQQDVPLAGFAEKLGVRHIIQGHVSKVGSEFRIVVRLVDALRDKLLWGESYQVSERELLTLQDKMAQQIASLLIPEHSGKTVNIDTSDTDSVEAYQHYLRGTYWWMNGKTSEWFYRAESAFLSAIEADPEFAAAYGNLAYIYARHDYHDIYMAPDVALDKAQNAIDKALALNSSETNAYFARAILSTASGQYSQAEHDLQYVLQSQPKNATALYLSAELALARNRYEQALSLAQTALQSEPLSPWVNVNLAIVHFWRGELDQALAGALKASTIDSQYTWAYVWQAKILLHQGKVAQAIEVMQLCLEIDNGSPTNAIFLALLYLELELLEEAQRWFGHAAALFGDSDEARFWQSFVRFFYYRENLEVASELFKKVTLKDTLFFSVYDYFHLVPEQVSESLADLVQPPAELQKVNHLNFSRQFMQASLSKKTGNTGLGDLQQLLSLSEPAAQSLNILSRLYHHKHDKELLTSLDTKHQVNWVLHGWMRHQMEAKPDTSLPPLQQAYFDQIGAKQALQRDMLLSQ
ncbi:MAG: winged helix-turn-helix domain-containing tetratricopeptide repeat protein [Aestuariibacter sp.]